MVSGAHSPNLVFGNAAVVHLSEVHAVKQLVPVQTIRGGSHGAVGSVRPKRKIGGIVEKRPAAHPLNLVVSMLPTPVARPWAVRTFMLIGVKLRRNRRRKRRSALHSWSAGRRFHHTVNGLRGSQSQPSGQRRRNCTHVRIRCKLSSTVRVDQPPPQASPPSDRPLSANLVDRMQRYWDATNYLTAAQFYLKDNPLLRRPLSTEDFKPRLLGHLGHIARAEFHLPPFE